MTKEIFIYSKSELGDTRGSLEDDLDDFLGRNGEVTGGGSGEYGQNIDLEIFNDETLEEMIQELIAFLRNQEVPKDTLLQIGERSFSISRNKGQDW